MSGLVLLLGVCVGKKTKSGFIFFPSPAFARILPCETFVALFCHFLSQSSSAASDPLRGKVTLTDKRSKVAKTMVDSQAVPSSQPTPVEVA